MSRTMLEVRPLCQLEPLEGRLLLCASLDTAVLSPAPLQETPTPSTLAASALLQRAAVTAPELVGTWAGRWKAIGRSGSFLLKVTRQVGRVTGSITVLSTTLGGTVTAKYSSGGGFSFSITKNGYSIKLNGKVIGNKMSGTFSATGSLGSASGTFTATRK